MAHNYNDLWIPSNAGELPSLVWGIKTATDADAETRRRNRQAPTPLDVERAIALVCAELMGLELDVKMFRGKLPDAIDPAYSLELTGEKPAVRANRRNFNAVCRGRSSDRAALLAAFGKLAGKLPLPDWLTVGSCRMSNPICLTRLELISGLETEAVSDGGSIKFQQIARLEAVCCTTPAAPVN